MAAYNFRKEVARYLKEGTTYDPLRQPIYDVVREATSPIAAGTTRQFFATPIGQGLGVNNAVKTLVDTNLRQAGQLPADPVFECWSPRIVVAFLDNASAAVPALNQQAEVLSDILYGASLSIRLVSQPKLEVPAFMLPGGVGITGFLQGFQAAAANFNQSFVTNGEPTQTACFRLDPFPIILPPQQTFTVELTYQRAVTMVAPAAEFHVWVVLDGILHRPALP